MGKPIKTLIISTFPPKHCGIATYAQEMSIYLRREHRTIYTLAVDPDATASYKLRLNSIKGLCKAFIICFFGRFDEIYVNFTEELIWPGLSRSDYRRYPVIIMQTLWMLLLGLKFRKKCHLIVHEVKTHPKSILSSLRSKLSFMFHHNIIFHTKAEQIDFLLGFSPFIKENQTKIQNHEKYMTPKFLGTKKEARQKLGLNDEDIIYLCIGFIQEHKGFDTAVKAFADASNENSKLFVVGSIRVNCKEFRAYRDKLSQQIKTTERAELVEQYLDDQTFDQWIKAADYVILPYSEIWSSGVGARTQMLGSKLILRDLENLLSQFDNKGDIQTFSSTKQLSDIISTNDLSPLNAKISSFSNDANKDLNLLKDKSILFVMPTFGDSVKGGAESFVYKLASQLANRGFKIEVWTTDSNQVIKRNHALKTKTDTTAKLTIRRFPANCWSERLFDFSHRSMNQEGRCGPIKRYIWKKTNLKGVGMRDTLKKEGHRFDVIHLFHYLLGSSHELAGIFPNKTILHPFFHDEPPLRNPVMRELFSGVRGITCNTDAAYTWSKNASSSMSPQLFVPIGNGIDELNRANPIGLNEKPSQLRSDNYVVFIGRLIAEKNIKEMIRFHAYAKNMNPSTPDLVMIGDGPLIADKDLSKDFIQIIKWVDETEKQKILRHAKALIQLSLLESFSLVAMEAWLCEVAIIVHKKCQATYSHIKRQPSAGFAVENQKEYLQALELLMNDEQLRINMGKSGREYVEKNYNWDAVCTNYASAVIQLTQN
jgi:glycosyltransferase involved in cell wall biosynthesis